MGTKKNPVDPPVNPPGILPFFNDTSKFLSSTKTSTSTAVPKVTYYNPAGDKAKISAVYGQSPTNPATTWRAKGVHTGIDFGVNANSPAYAITGGRVINTGYDPAVGNYISLRTGTGKYINYEHLNSIGVKKNQFVTGGTILGKTGNTGTASEGPHLHTEFVLNGNLVAPEKYFNIQNEANEPDWIHGGENDKAPQNLGTAFQYAGMPAHNVSGRPASTTVVPKPDITPNPSAGTDPNKTVINSGSRNNAFSAGRAGSFDMSPTQSVDLSSFAGSSSSTIGRPRTAGMINV